MPSTRDQAQEHLNSYVEAFERCVRGALDEFTTEYGPLRHKLSKRSQASIIHDLMVANFRAEFGTARDSVGPVAVHHKNNLSLVVVENGRYKIKLKKLDERLLAKNIPTQAALRFVWQQLAFKQVEPPTHLHIGYQVVDEASLTSSKVWVTCPAGNQVGWSWELTDGATATGTPNAEIKQLAPAPAEKPPRRVKLKRQEGEASVEENDGTASGSA